MTNFYLKEGVDLLEVPWDHPGGRTVQSNQLGGCPDLQRPHQYTTKWTPWNYRTGRRSGFSWSVSVSPLNQILKEKHEQKLGMSRVFKYLTIAGSHR